MGCLQKNCNLLNNSTNRSNDWGRLLEWLCYYCQQFLKLLQNKYSFHPLYPLYDFWTIFSRKCRLVQKMSTIVVCWFLKLIFHNKIISLEFCPSFRIHWDVIKSHFSNSVTCAKFILNSSGTIGQNLKTRWINKSRIYLACIFFFNSLLTLIEQFVC